MNIEGLKSEFQLLATSIKKIDFRNNFVYFEDNEDIVRRFEVSYEIDDISFDNEDNTVMGTISLNVTINVTNKDAEMNCDLIIQGCFISNDKIPTEEFKNMLQVNGCATLYSIARAMILNISSQACFGAHLLLPMINLFKLKEIKDSNKTEEEKI